MQEIEKRKNDGALVSKNDAVRVRSNLVQLAIIVGSRETLQDSEPVAVVSTYRKYFYPRTGWELKDVIVKGLPQNLRFLILKDMECIETPQAGCFILFCRK